MTTYSGTKEFEGAIFVKAGSSKSPVSRSAFAPWKKGPESRAATTGIGSFSIHTPAKLGTEL